MKKAIADTKHKTAIVRLELVVMLLLLPPFMLLVYTPVGVVCHFALSMVGMVGGCQLG